VVVGEIGGAFVEAGTVEIGYAVVESCWGRGHASDAVREYVEVARDVPPIERLVAHTPLDRPASGRVVAKAGFTPAGEIEEGYEGTTMRVQRWELDV
jgi:ribosomal-protein-alanine N-acetyltransferase